MVRGNCDYDSGYPERLVVKLGDVIIAQTHGHLFGINFTWDKLDLWAQQEDADICLYGHLHVAAAWRMVRQCISIQVLFHSHVAQSMRNSMLR